MNDMTRSAESRATRLVAGKPGAGRSLGPHLPPPMAQDPPPRRPLRAGPFGVLDVGSTKVTCLIGRVDGDGRLRVLGFGMRQSRGVRAGGITDLDGAEQAVRGAVGDAEIQADHRLRSVLVNLTCGSPESRVFGVQWPVGGRAVTEADVRRVVQEGRARAAVEGRETIHALPLGFAADGTLGVADPRGLHCDLLSARLHMVDAAATALRNLETTVLRCELYISELVSAPLAAGLSSLVEDERQLGATVIDMGGGTTGIGVFSEGNLLHTAQLAVGGSHVTNDLARVLSTSVADAERLKTVYGNAEGSPDDEREILSVPLVGEEEHHFAKIPRSQLVDVIRPRLEETFELVRERLDQAGVTREVGTRVVLTGGASQLAGAREMAGRVLDRQVRLGRPLPLRGLADDVSGPGFATAAGLLNWAGGVGRTLADIDTSDDQSVDWISRAVTFIRNRL
jgi:cell division protein FtsA